MLRNTSLCGPGRLRIWMGGWVHQVHLAWAGSESVWSTNVHHSHKQRACGVLHFSAIATRYVSSNQCPGQRAIASGCFSRSKRTSLKLRMSGRSKPRRTSHASRVEASSSNLTQGWTPNSPGEKSHTRPFFSCVQVCHYCSSLATTKDSSACCIIAARRFMDEIQVWFGLAAKADAIVAASGHQLRRVTKSQHLGTQQ